MKFKTLTPIVALALMPVAGLVALTLALSTGTPSVSASSERNGHLHAVKECSSYTGEAGSFCTITSSNLAEIKVGSNVFYDQAAGVPAGLLDSNVVLDAGHGNRAVGRCTLDLTTNLGLCTFSTAPDSSPASKPVSVSTARQEHHNAAWTGPIASARAIESIDAHTGKGRRSRRPFCPEPTSLSPDDGDAFQRGASQGRPSRERILVRARSVDG
jgi:hypothetical protein